jgi:hypothetical protein
MLHHGCQTAWEFQHDAEADGCKKLCRLHHPHCNSIMHGGSQQGGDKMVSMMTVVQQDPLHNASPEMSELTGPVANLSTPMHPLPRLPGLSDDFT